MDVLHIIGVDVQDLVDHSEQDLFIGIGQAWTDRLKVLLVLTKVLELFELEDELKVAIGLD